MEENNINRLFIKTTEFFRLSETKTLDDLDLPSTTALHSNIIQKKTFLKKIYIDFYNQFKRALKSNINTKVIVELGSGGGFIKKIIPHAITSDIVSSKELDIVFSGLHIPFKDKKIAAFVMVDVLHHINDVRSFFKELNRCLKVSGKIIMIEPANTLLGGYIWRCFHHEPFDPSGGWGFEKEGRLSSANGAIPYIVFCRDRQQFEKEFPSFKVLKMKSHTPFRYIVSGGVSIRQLLPSFTYNIVKGIELILSPLNKYYGMFLTIELEKVS